MKRVSIVVLALWQLAAAGAVTLYQVPYWGSLTNGVPNTNRMTNWWSGNALPQWWYTNVWNPTGDTNSVLPWQAWQIMNTNLANIQGALNAALNTNTLQVQLYPSSNATNFTLDFGTNYAANLAFFIFATNNVYLVQPVNLHSGQPSALWVYQDSTGNRTVNVDTNYWRRVGGITPTATTNAGAFDLYSMQTMPFGTNVAFGISPNFK